MQAGSFNLYFITIASFYIQNLWYSIKYFAYLIAGYVSYE